jgi:outer membrane biosynthesis protein TonB
MIRRFELIEPVFVQSQEPKRIIEAGTVIEVGEDNTMFTAEWIERVLAKGGIVELEPLPEPKPKAVAIKAVPPVVKPEPKPEPAKKPEKKKPDVEPEKQKDEIVKTEEAK